jgi:muramidase (phage lysozyme)
MGQDDPGALVKVFSSISKSLDVIVKDLSSQNKSLQNSEKVDRKKGEDEKRRKRESGLEQGIGKIVSVASKMLAPVRGILDKIWNFIFYTLLGRAFIKFTDWFNDPKNKDEVETLKRFLKDWWPSLLGAFVLFATPFGSFVRTFVGTVTKLTFQLAKFAIPKLAKFVAKNPLVAAGAVTGIAAGAGYMMEQNRMNEIAKKQGTKPEKRGEGSLFNEIGKAFNPGQLGMGGVSITGHNSGGIVPTNKRNISTTGHNSGGIVPTNKRNVSTTGYNSGGIVPTFEGGGTIDESTGLKISGAGEDTQLIAAKPGEIVIPTETVDKYGAPFFMKLIRSSGKSGMPKMVNNIQLAKDGGIVGGMMSGIGRMFGAKSNTKISKPSWYGPAPIYDHKTPTVKAILRTLKTAEGTIKGKNPYDVVYGGKMIPVTQMTVKELIDTQMTDVLPKKFGGGRAPWPKGSVASGAYQFMPDTLKQLITMNILRPTDKMTAETQDRAAWALIERRGVSLHQLKSQGLSRGILNTLGYEWASLPNLQGKSHYNQPVKSAEFLQNVYNQSLNLPDKSSPINTVKPKDNKMNLGLQVKLSPVEPPNTSSKSSFIQLPDIYQSTGKPVSSGAESKLPHITDKITETQRINASIYGIA